jgi:integrase
MDYVAKPVSDSTRKLYTSALNKIKKHGIDIDNIEIDELETICIKNNYTKSNRYLLHKSVLWYSKNENKNTELIEKIYEIVKKNMKEDKDKYLDNKLFESEIDKYINWDSILHIYNQLEELYNNHPNDDNIIEEYLILSLYVITLPRRVEDYLYMSIKNIELNRESDTIIWTNENNLIKYNNNNKYDSDKVKKLHNEEENIKENYYIIKEDTSYFVFNKFKTHKYYKTQIIEVPKKLDTIIKKYIDHKKIKNNEMFFNFSKSLFILKINKIFEKYINKKISINIIRHSRITKELSNNRITEREKIIISHMMGHSLETQAIYKKYVGDESDSDNNDEIIKQINQNALIVNNTGNKKLIVGRPQKYKTEEEKIEAKKQAKIRFKNKIISEKNKD